MLSLEISYTDFNDEVQNERCYFHLSVAELTELQVSHEEGYDAYLTSLIESGDAAKIFVEVKNLIAKSYGVKSEDGKRFTKSQELSDEFMSSPAFDSLLLKMMQDQDYVTSFIQGIIPSVDKLFPDMPEEKRAALLAQMESAKK